MRFTHQILAYLRPVGFKARTVVYSCSNAVRNSIGAAHAYGKRTCALIHDIATNLPYILVPAPEEYALQARQRLKGRHTVFVPVEKDGVTAYQPYIDQPPALPGRVRVKLYHDFDVLYRDSVLCVDIPLGSSGELDLKLVQRRWNLQNCFVVDSNRLQFFEPEVPGILSSLAVRLLMDNHFWLRVIERPSPGRIAARSIRYSIRQRSESLRCWWQKVVDSSPAKSVKKRYSAFGFIAACLITMRYFDSVHRQHEFYLEDLIEFLWRFVSEAAST
ncbi:hypothetical protein BDW22DRAFT_1356048 [Trametopsis cervina]|nr:hypothetical protein BDW22DRAFT_1356048 [Trametopsis cervina]